MRPAHGRHAKSALQNYGAASGAEALGSPGARNEHAGSLQPTSNAARRDASVVDAMS